jgi:Amidase
MRYNNLRAPLKDDPMESSVKFLLTVGGWPRWFRTFVTYVVHYILRDPVTAATVALVGNKTAGQSVSWVAKRQAFRQQFNDFFAEGEYDALIAPVSTIPAAKVNGSTMVSALATSTLLYNVLDYPVGAVPVTTVQEGEVMEEGRWKGREQEGYAWMFLDQVYGKGEVYKKIMEDGVGLPVGVQVPTRLIRGVKLRLSGP